MKTITFKTEDLKEWTINVKQITCMYPLKTEKGTYVYLSCGTKLLALSSVSQLLSMINEND